MCVEMSKSIPHDLQNLGLRTTDLVNALHTAYGRTQEGGMVSTDHPQARGSTKHCLSSDRILADDFWLATVELETHLPCRKLNWLEVMKDVIKTAPQSSVVQVEHTHLRSQLLYYAMNGEAK